MTPQHAPQTHRRRRLEIPFAVLFVLLLVTAAAADYPKAPDNTDTCEFNPEWLTNPEWTDEVEFSDKTPNGDPDSSFCDFYRFSWQNFLYLVSPRGPQDSGNDYPTKFLEQEKYHAYTSGEDPCTGTAPAHTFFRFTPTGFEPRPMRSVTHQGAKPDIHQAQSKAVIYDQQGNAAIYSMRFSKDMCDLRKTLTNFYFPKGTTELKMAWRVLGKTDQKGNYYTVEVSNQDLGLSGNGQQTLGLIGFHIAIATKAHPEMIWITIEHNLNNPLCSGEDRFDPEMVTSHDKANLADKWSFTNSECFELIEKYASASAEDRQALKKELETCNFNDPDEFSENAKITGKPTELCQVSQFGQIPGYNPQENIDNNRDNQAAIQSLYEAFLDALKDEEAPEWPEVWTNYRMVGALWLSQPVEEKENGEYVFGPFNPSCTEDGASTIQCDGTPVDGKPPENTHQRGSLALANSVAETDYQGPLPWDANPHDWSGLRNCFGCHGFTPNDFPSLLPIAEVEDQQAVYGRNDVRKVTEGTGTISHIMNGLVDQQCERSFKFVRSGLISEEHLSLPNLITNKCSRVCPIDKAWTGKFYVDPYERDTEGDMPFYCQCC